MSAPRLHLSKFQKHSCRLLPNCTAAVIGVDSRGATYLIIGIHLACRPSPRLHYPHLARWQFSKPQSPSFTMSQPTKTFSMWVEGNEVSGNAEQSVSEPLGGDAPHYLT
jgi:hypothetical protein